MSQPRYCIGIDLGTTNCALAYVDTLADGDRSTLFPIPQNLSETTRGIAEILPSTVALLDSGTRLVGRGALELMAFGATPVVSSAKSWLIVDAVDRRAPLLPTDRVLTPPATKVSPVEASAIYLSHLREQWDEAMAAFDHSYRLEHQQVVVTVPASFDPIAQALTREAIELAGLPRSTTLLEEPVAAFHHFLEQDEAVLSHLTRRPARILVVDIGGGTTDCSLLELDRSGELRRIKVGEHLLIGGDTIDLAISHLVQRQLSGTLSPRAWTSVIYQSRRLKEAYLSGEVAAHGVFSLTIAGEGSNLFGSTQTINITPAELEDLILEGFFPLCESSDTPGPRTTALREVGLPFPADVAITRHLAAFLWGDSDGGGGGATRSSIKVDGVLYTGGSLLSPLIQDRLTRLITRWQQGVAPVVLPNRSHLLAVAHGAARYALSTRARARRVAMAYPRSLYLDIGEGNLLCVFAQGHHTGDEVVIEQTPLVATTNKPVRLQLFSSTMRPDDREGEIVPRNPASFRPFPPATTVLATERDRGAAQTIRVQLAIHLTEVGSLALSCVDPFGGHRWTIEFHLSDEKVSSHAPRNPALESAIDLVRGVFGKGRDDSPSGMMTRLEKTLGTPRDTWDIKTVRSLWGPLAESLTRRGKSVKHEVAWLQCAGHALRPGIGDESDSLRINELWRIRTVGTPHRREPSVILAMTIAWRRVAAGISAERQSELAEELAKGDISNPETVRLLASLERLSQPAKQQIAQRAIKLLAASQRDAQILGLWSLARVGAREPLYAASRYVLPADMIEEIVKRLAKSSQLPEPHRSRAIAQLIRRTNDPNRDVTASVWDAAAATISDQWLLFARGEGDTHDTEGALLGDSLPAGIRLMRER